MARKVKCKICGKTNTNDEAYCVNDNGKNKYYCSQGEYEEMQQEVKSKEECYSYILEIIGAKFIPPALIKMINGLRKYYDYNIIKRTFKECRNSIEWSVSNKDFNTEFTKYKYVVTIVANNINKTYKDWLKEQEELQKLFNQPSSNNIDVEILNLDRIEVKPKQNTDISAFLED